MTTSTPVRACLMDASLEYSTWITLNCIGGALNAHSPGSTQHITNNLLIRWIFYLAGKDDDLLDDSSNLVLEELLNNVATNGSSPATAKFVYPDNSIVQQRI